LLCQFQRLGPYSQCFLNLAADRFWAGVRVPDCHAPTMIKIACRIFSGRWPQAAIICSNYGSMDGWFLLTDFDLPNRLIFVVTTRHRTSLLRKAAQRNLRNLDERLSSLKGADWHTSTLVRSSGTVRGIPHGARIGHGSAGSLTIQTVLFDKCTPPGNG
jgi:hypothetical protein